MKAAGRLLLLLSGVAKGADGTVGGATNVLLLQDGTGLLLQDGSYIVLQ